MFNGTALAFTETFQKSILLFCVLGFVSGERLSINKNFFLFDIGIILYVFSSIFIGLMLKNKRGLFLLKASTGNMIFFLSIVILPSFFLLLFSNNLEESLGFLLQYVFLLVLIPVFLDSVYRNHHMTFLLKSLFVALVVLGFAFLGFYLGFIEDFIFNRVSLESDLDSKFGSRFTVGEFTPNEMGHYFVLLAFLVTFLYASKKSKKIVAIIAMIPYLLTLSKTVWLQMFAYFMIVKFSLRVWFILFLCFIYVLLFQQGVLEIFKFLINDFSLESTSNSVRLEMYLDSILYIPYSIIFPAYHSIDNLVVQDIDVISTHNGVLSYIINFGLVSFLILFFGIVFFLKKTYKNVEFHFFMVFIFLDLIVLMFNPLINSRIMWFPLFLYIFLFARSNNKF